MTSLKKLKNYLYYGFFIVCLTLTSCTEEENPDPNPNDISGVEDPNEDPGSKLTLDANVIQSRLLLQNVNSVNGKIPPSSNSADLKLDKDTIFLVEDFKNRIRILYPGQGIATGSSHFYLQVEGADEYLDIKPVEEESSDTIGVFYMGFDPGDFDLPFSFNIKFAPHDNTGTSPIDEIGKVVVIEKKGDLSCSPSSPEPHWDWIWTTIDGINHSAPGYGRATEGSVNGCCLEGVSVDCIANGLPESEWISLDYTSTYRIEYETLHFSSDLSGGLREISQNIDPSESDFCNGSPSYKHSIRDHLFWGDYSYDPSNGQVQFTNLKSREREIYLDGLDFTITDNDKYFISPDFLYEIISCHFLMETASIEGTTMIRLFERRTDPDEKWYD